MRILVLCSDTGVRVGDVKGAALHLQAITSAFAALGHETEVVGVAGNPAGPLLGWPVPTHLVPHPGRAQGLLRERRKREVVERIAALGSEVALRLRPHVVYERLSLFGTAGARVAAGAGASHVLEVNALLAREESTWRGLNDVSSAGRIEQDVLAGAHLCVAVSDEIASQIRPSCAAGPAVVVPNGVDVELFRVRPPRVLARSELGLPSSASLVAFTGSLRPWHGLDSAIEALAALPATVHLVVAGDGPVRVRLERLAERLGLADRVHWLGQVPHDRIPLVLAACDAAVAPYPDLDGFAFSPLKLYEYLAAGVPVVASSIGQIRRCLDDGRWGSLVAPGDPAALAAGIGAVLAAPDLAAVRADQARAHALAQHGWANRAQQVLDHLADLPGAGRRASSS